MRRLRFGDKLLRVRDEPEPPPREGYSPPPLFCIHGAGMSSVVFVDLLRRFAPGRRVIAPDLPGHGQADRWHDEISIAGYRDAVGTICATLKLPRVVFIGHSMGAAIALSCALAWPERVAGLVLLNGAAHLEVPDEIHSLLDASLPMGPAGAPSRVDRMPDAFAELSFSPETRPELRARWQAVLFAAERDVVLDDFAACQGFDVRKRLPELSLPTLLISGRDDLLVSSEGIEETATLLCKGPAVHAVVPDSGHLSHLEQPELCYSLIEKFLLSGPRQELSLSDDSAKTSGLAGS